MNYFKRYISGEKKKVWEELGNLGGLIYEPPYYNEGLEICQHACEITLKNLKSIIEELKRIEFKFGSESDDDFKQHDPLYPPSQAAINLVEWLEERFGKISLIAKTFIITVGDVNLNGTHEKWNNEFLPIDPFIMEFDCTRYGEDPKAYFEGEMEAWEDYHEDDEMFGLPFAPDHLHKANISGGLPYKLLVPSNCINPMLDLDGEKMTMVDYLNLNFEKKFFRFAENESEKEIIEELNVKLEKI